MLILSYSSCSTPPVDIVTNAAEKNVKIATNLESALASLFRANQEAEVPIVAIFANILRLRVGFLLIRVKNSFARFESFPSLHLEKMNLVPDEPPFPILTTESLYVVSNTTLVGGPSCMLTILPLSQILYEEDQRTLSQRNSTTTDCICARFLSFLIQ